MYRERDMRVLIAVSAVLVLPDFCPAITIVVDPGGGGEFTEIQQAIDAALDGEEVLVRSGEYVVTEPINFRGKLISVRGDYGAEETTIRLSAASGSVVVFDSGETSEALLEGFTLTGGNASTGGGIRCVNSSPKLVACVITGNYAADVGGGVYCESSSPTLEDCAIVNNLASLSGGGLMCYQAAFPKFTGGTSSTNKSLRDGGAITTYIDCSPTFTGTIISGNSSDRLGGATCCDTNCSLTFNSCRILGNFAELYGGGLLSYRGTSMTMTDCIIAGNLALQNGGGALAADKNSRSTLTNCTIYANKARTDGLTWCLSGSIMNFNDCILWENSPAGMNCGDIKNCLSEDPLFVYGGEFNFSQFQDVELSGITYQVPDFMVDSPDYCLWEASPAIGAGAEGGNLGADTGICEMEEIGFRRGDIDGNGRLDLTDIIKFLNYQFVGSVETLDCEDAADIDDNGILDLSDAIRSLNFQFTGSASAPEPPGSEQCGFDTTFDSLTCTKYPLCETPD